MQLVKLVKPLLLLGLIMFSSCEPDQEAKLLVGRVYINEATLDKIEFAEKNIIIFTWASDYDLFWRKGKPFKYNYWIDEKNRIHLGGFSTSGEYDKFPYRNGLEFSPLKDEIYFVDRNRKSGIFKGGN